MGKVQGESRGGITRGVPGGDLPLTDFQSLICQQVVVAVVVVVVVISI